MYQAFFPTSLIGHDLELNELAHLLQSGGSCLVTGVPGSGRETLVRVAAQKIGARVVEIDCLRTTGIRSFLRVLADRLLGLYQTPEDLIVIQNWSLEHRFILEYPSSGSARLVWHVGAGQEWHVLKELLTLPDTFSKSSGLRVVLVLRNFPHVESWDRQDKWQHQITPLLAETGLVNVVLTASVPGSWPDTQVLNPLELLPIPDQVLRRWIQQEVEPLNLSFDAESKALELYLSYVQGHLGDTIALGRRILTDYLVHSSDAEPRVIQAHHVHRSMISLVQDIAVTFESLLLQLPPIQIRVLESLCIDPTNKPYAKQYIAKHSLSRGGSLQGALSSLQQKGLIYGSQNQYRIALPLLDFWLKQRLS